MRAPFLANHWQDRARAATPRHPSLGDRPQQPPRPIAPDDTPVSGAVPDRASAERVLRALADEVTASTAAAALLAGDYAAGDSATDDSATDDGAGAESDDLDPSQLVAVASDPVGTDARLSAEVMRLGWEAGGRAFDAGLSVHHVVRDADLLLAIVLTDLERCVETLPPDVTATPADAFGAARRLQRGMGRYTQAAASGFVHALLRSLRERYRLLRHDLRNPLGTIRSALSLMEDESVPEEMRHGPGIRSMVARNAGSLDALIGSGLDDAAANALLIPPQHIALRDVAIAARREVREAARLAECEVVIGDVPDAPPSYVDPAALELTLAALLLAALSNAARGDEVRIDCTDRGDLTGVDASESPSGQRCAVVRITLTHAASPSDSDTVARWDPEGLALASLLALDHGGALSAAPSGSAVGEAAALVHADVLYLRLPISDDASVPATSALPPH